MSLSKGCPAIASHDPQTGRQHDREERHAVLTGSREHVPRRQGCYHGPAPIPEEGRGSRPMRFRHLRPHARCGLVRTAAGRLQADAERQERHHRGGPRRDHRLLGMTHSAAMAGEILPGKTILEALNTDLVCDAINVAMREIFLQIVYGRTPDRLLRGRPARRRLPLTTSARACAPGRHHVRHQGQGRSLPRAGRGLRHPHGSQRQERDHRLQFLNLGKMTDAVKAGKTPEEAIAGAMRRTVGERCQVHRPRTDAGPHSVASAFPVHE